MRDKETVLIVDDEEMVLTSLATYLTLETDYEVVTFTSARAALAHVRGHDVDLVISDFLMPEMDGIVFLSEVRRLKPEIPRVILTGYADKENAIKAINDVGLAPHHPQRDREEEAAGEAGGQGRRDQSGLLGAAEHSAGDPQGVRLARIIHQRSPACADR
jgi:CheY-like chemotaxis protein